jgi:nicotinate-nucleotide adenylyltransferase
MLRGLFGGSFDPVHSGHLIVARSAAEQLRLDVVHFIPACVQPFKAGRDLAPAIDRLAMLRLALAGEEGFLLDDREVRRSGISYTIDTLEEMRAEFPSDQLSLMVGADAAREFSAWTEASRIPRLAQVTILTRPGSEIAPGSLPFAVVEVPAVDISASDIRRRVRAGEPIDGLVPDGVAAYIATHGLYCRRD